MSGENDKPIGFGANTDTETNTDTDTDTDTDTGTSRDEIGFEEIDDSGLNVTGTRLAAAGTIGAILVAWLLDFRYGSHREPLFVVGGGNLPITFAPNPGNVEWLFVLTIVLLFFAVGRPLYQNPRRTSYYWKEFKTNTAAVASLYFLAFVFVLALLGPFVFGHPELDPANAYQPPVFAGGSWDHPFGTMQSGEDILQIVAIGARVSMMVGLIGALMIVVLATAVGTTAAYFGGLVDEVLMRAVDILLTFPTFFLILFIVYLYGGNLFTIILILGLTTWAGTSRIVRSEALQRSEEAYIDVAKSVGASERWIITRHLVPNVSNSIITAATLAVPSLILYEAVLAFLGFGDPNVWSWGRVIAAGRSDMQNAWWITMIPGTFLFLTVLACNFLGDGVRDALDPRHESGTKRK